jgi:hypothetical protein
MNFMDAHKLATEQHAVRRQGWPQDQHLRHHVEESQSKLKLHSPDAPDATDWAPNDEDQAAQDWEQYTPQQKQAEETADKPEPKHKK